MKDRITVKVTAKTKETTKIYEKWIDFVIFPFFPPFFLFVCYFTPDILHSSLVNLSFTTTGIMLVYERYVTWRRKKNHIGNIDGLLSILCQLYNMKYKWFYVYKAIKIHCYHYYCYRCPSYGLSSTRTRLSNLLINNYNYNATLSLS